MSQAAVEQPPPELPRTLREVTALQNDLVAQAMAVFEEATRTASARMTREAQTEMVMMMRRAADIEGVMLAILDKLNQEVRLESAREIFERLHQGAFTPPAAEEEPRRRSGHRKPRPGRHSHLRPIAAAAAVAAVTVAGGGAMAMHDDASQQPVSVALRPAMNLASQFPPDSAVPRPSVHHRAGQDAKTAAPAPAPALSAPVVTAAPPQPSPSPSPEPGLLVSVRDLDLTGTTGTFTLSAPSGAVDWSVTTDIPGASLSVVQGVLDSAQEPVTVVLTDPLGESGAVYVRWGNRGIATIWVTSSLGSLPVSLPSL